MRETGSEHEAAGWMGHALHSAAGWLSTPFSALDLAQAIVLWLVVIPPGVGLLARAVADERIGENFRAYLEEGLEWGTRHPWLLYLAGCSRCLSHHFGLAVSVAALVAVPFPVNPVVWLVLTLSSIRVTVVFWIK